MFPHFAECSGHCQIVHQLTILSFCVSVRSVKSGSRGFFRCIHIRVSMRNLPMVLSLRWSRITVFPPFMGRYCAMQCHQVKRHVHILSNRCEHHVDPVNDDKLFQNPPC